MANRPHFIEEPLDPNSQQFRSDCMAWELYTKKSAPDRNAFIASQPGLQTAEFNTRLRRCEAWWLLTYCTPFQIESTVAELLPVDMKEVREHLALMRLEMKTIRQRKFKTAPRSKAHA